MCLRFDGEIIISGEKFSSYFMCDWSNYKVGCAHFHAVFNANIYALNQYGQ